jgi:xylonate dehydratase
VQTLGARFAHGIVTSTKPPIEVGCRACGSPGGGCQFLGTAATSQVVAEALGMALPHSALAPSGEPVWLDMARRSALAVMRLAALSRRPLDPHADALENAMVVHAAFGGSTNLLLHLPGHRPRRRAAKARPWPTGWGEPRRAPPRGRAAQRTARPPHRAGLPGRRRARGDAAPAPDGPARPKRAHRDGRERWTRCSTGGRRARAGGLREERLREADGIDPDDVIMDPDARAATGSLPRSFPVGNLAPGGSVVKSDGPRPVGGGCRRRSTAPRARARVHVEKAPIAAVKGLERSRRCCRATCWC